MAAQAPQSMGCLNVVSIAGGFDACAAAGKTVSNPNSLRLMETDGRFSVMTWGLSITITQ
ncbi:hypothetical protein [Limnohabitans sp. Rim28]|uniref:hypothetical protein n=1 Tax=Limnohabitans sp. Rim28 TaxID=1100720 RepID=UPI0004744B5F|nr:hypothetical protein [Limnohabitans sp. Rim28]